MIHSDPSWPILTEYYKVEVKPSTKSVNLKTRKNKRVANSRIKRAAKRTSIDRKMVAGFLSLNNATSTTNKWSKVKERGLYYKREVLSHIPKCHSVSNWKQKASFGALQIIQIYNAHSGQCESMWTIRKSKWRISLYDDTQRFRLIQDCWSSPIHSWKEFCFAGPPSLEFDIHTVF